MQVPRPSVLSLQLRWCKLLPFKIILNILRYLELRRLILLLERHVNGTLPQLLQALDVGATCSGEEPEAGGGSVVGLVRRSIRRRKDWILEIVVLRL